MKRYLLFALLLTVVAQPAAAFTYGVPKAPKAATFFLSEAQLDVEERMTPSRLPDGSLGYRLVLPVSVVQSSLFITVDGKPAPSVSWAAESTWQGVAHEDFGLDGRLTLNPEAEQDQTRKALLQTMLLQKKNKDAAAGRLGAAETALSMWHRGFGNAASVSVDDLVKLGTTLVEAIPGTLTALEAERNAVAESSRLYSEALHALREYDTAHRVLVAYVSAEAQGSGLVRYSYLLSAASVPSYRMNAFPEKNELSIEQLATLWQTTGTDWKGVDVSLAFFQHSRALAPNSPYSWVVDEQSSMSRSKDLGSAQRVMMDAGGEDFKSKNNQLMAPSPVAKPAPVQQSMTSFRLWKLGKQDLVSGEPLTLTLDHSTYKTEFYYTLRPQQARRGFLTADLVLPEAVEMPQGTLACFVDSYFTGNQAFAMNSNKTTIFLGEDPQVTVSKQELSKLRGEEGFISKDKVRTWHWKIAVTNMRSREIAVRVQEPAPITWDKATKISTETKPRPESLIYEDPSRSQQSVHLLVWKKTLAPKEVFTIDYKVEVRQ